MSGPVCQSAEETALILVKKEDFRRKAEAAVKVEILFIYIKDYEKVVCCSDDDGVRFIHVRTGANSW